MRVLKTTDGVNEKLAPMFNPRPRILPIPLLLHVVGYFAHIAFQTPEPERLLWSANNVPLHSVE